MSRPELPKDLEVYIESIDEQGRATYISGYFELHQTRLKFDAIGMEGWSSVIFERERDRTRHVFSLDFLLARLNEWDLGPRAERRLKRTLRERLQRRA